MEVSKEIAEKKDNKILSQERITKECPICLEDRKIYLKFGCGHSVCYMCSANFRKTQTKLCPFCRKEIRKKTYELTFDELLSLAVKFDSETLEAIRVDDLNLFWSMDLANSELWSIRLRSSDAKSRLEKLGVLKKHVFPMMSVFRRRETLFSICNMSHSRVYFVNSNREVINQEILESNELMKKIDAHSRSTFESFKELLGTAPSKYKGLDPNRSVVTLSDDTSLTFKQYALYVSDDWDLFVEKNNHSYDKEYLEIFRECLERGDKDLVTTKSYFSSKYKSKKRTLNNVYKEKQLRIITSWEISKRKNIIQQKLYSLAKDRPSASIAWLKLWIDTGEQSPESFEQDWNDTLEYMTYEGLIEIENDELRILKLA
jgi:hypothetical protein